MFTIQHRIRPLVIALLIPIFVVACGSSNSSSPPDGPNPDGGAESSELSGEAGSATLRIERSGSITGTDTRWEVAAEFPITVYFDQGEDSPIFYSTGEGTAIMTSVDVGATGITMNTTAIFNVQFEVHGAFNASDCSVEIYVKEVWAEGAEVVAEVDGVVLEGVTDEFVIFTTNTYEYKSMKFPFGVGQVTRQRTIGNVNWAAAFTITSLSVPEHTNCGTFDYFDEEYESEEIVD
jgi:hypothetical protein